FAVQCCLKQRRLRGSYLSSLNSARPLPTLIHGPSATRQLAGCKMSLLLAEVSASIMSFDPIDTLSAEHHEAVRSALKVAFGSQEPAAIVPVGGGASSAFPFRVEIGGRHCLVRVEGSASPLRNPHQYESMRIASDAGIAPRIYYVDEMSRVVVMDF